MAGKRAVDRSSKHASPWLMPILATLLGFASISTDLFLPALPAMRLALQTTEGALHFAISGYLLGFGFGQLIWGPVSDRYGRRVPVACGTLVFVIGSAGCALSGDAVSLVGWRVVQALGASAGVVLARAMVRDLYQRNEAARVLSTLMTVMAIAPLLGPTIGAQILKLAPWQAIFWTLVGFGLITFAAVLTLPETLPAAKREAISPWRVLGLYGGFLKNGRLIGYSLAVSCFFAGVFANVAGGPFAFIAVHGVSPEVYGLIFAGSVVGLMATNMLNARFVRSVGSDRMLLVGAVGVALCGVLTLLVAMTGFAGAAGLALVQLLYHAMNGLVVANGVAGALATVETRAGAAAAVVGAFQYGGGMAGSALIGLLADGTVVPMGAVMALAGFSCLAAVHATLRGRGQKPPAH